jgi:hypothetical protein
MRWLGLGSKLREPIVGLHLLLQLPPNLKMNPKHENLLSAEEKDTQISNPTSLPHYPSMQYVDYGAVCFQLQL